MIWAILIILKYHCRKLFWLTTLVCDNFGRTILVIPAAFSDLINSLALFEVTDWSYQAIEEKHRINGLNDGLWDGWALLSDASVFSVNYLKKTLWRMLNIDSWSIDIGAEDKPYQHSLHYSNYLHYLLQYSILSRWVHCRKTSSWYDIPIIISINLFVTVKNRLEYQLVRELWFPSRFSNRSSVKVICGYCQLCKTMGE